MKPHFERLVAGQGVTPDQRLRPPASKPSAKTPAEVVQPQDTTVSVANLQEAGTPTQPAMSRRSPGYPAWLAAAYSGSGEVEKAFAWLKSAAQERNLWLLHTLKSPAFDILRDDPKFAEILVDLPS